MAFALDKLPDIDKLATLLDTEEKKIAFVEVFYDQGSECPNEWGNEQLYSFNRDHTNYIDLEEFLEDSEKYPLDRTVFLQYTEHGPPCEWSVMNDQPVDNFHDVRFGGAIVFTEDHGIDDLTQAAENYCETYTAWCNGEVYCLLAKVYDIVTDSNGNVIKDENHYAMNYTAIVDEIVGGYFDYDTYLLSELRSMIQ